MPKSTIENWPLETYPWRTKLLTEGFQGKKAFDIHTNFFKAEVRNAEGGLDFKSFSPKDKEGNVIPELAQHRVGGVTTPMRPLPEDQDEKAPEWSGNRSRIWPEDLRLLEKELGGLPTHVLAGLWFRYDEKLKSWEPVDREKITYPPYFADVSERYFNSWRPAAYKDLVDPYAGQERPYTKIQKLELELRAKQAELDAKNSAVVIGTP